MKNFKNVKNYKEAMRFFKYALFVPVFNEDHSLNTDVDTSISVYLVHYLLDNAKNNEVRKAVYDYFNCIAFHQSVGEHDYVCLQNNYTLADRVGVIQLKEFAGHNGNEAVLADEFKKIELYNASVLVRGYNL